MSTRYARTADRATNEKNAKILKALLQQTPNKYCADCKKKDAQWASWNLGIFICIRCSGIHRSLGVHISKVKSVDLDTWVPEQVENMIRWGNERANKYWEANLGDRKPTESNMEMWIRAKYEQKRWAMKGPIPDPSTLGDSKSVQNQEEPSQPPVKQTVVEQPKTKQSEFANLDAFLGSPSSSPASTHQTTTTSASQLQGADFFFGTSTSPPSQQQQQQQQQPQQQQHNDIKSSILSLYNTMPAAQPPMMQQQQQQQQQQFMAGNVQNQLSGLNFGYQQQPMNNNVWGSFATASPMQPQQQQQHSLPQGSQFFTSSSKNNSHNASTNNVPKEPKKDVFADLLG
ncbi:unnamed protein product [Rhizopus microsporus]